jgi:hypothetical protein
MVLHIGQIIEGRPIDTEDVINLVVDILVNTFIDEANKHIPLVLRLPIFEGNK